MPIQELVGKQHPCFDLMEQMKRKNTVLDSRSYHSYEIPKLDLVHFLQLPQGLPSVLMRLQPRGRFLKMVGVWPAIFEWLQHVKNPIFLLLNLQMSVGVLRMLLVPKFPKAQPTRPCFFPGDGAAEIRIDWVHQLRHLWVVQMLSASLDHFRHTLTSCLKPKTWERFLFGLWMGVDMGWWSLPNWHFGKIDID